MKNSSEKKRNSFGTYLGLVFSDFFKSFKYNREKLPAWFIAVPAIVMGFTITTFYNACVTYMETNFNGFFVFAFLVLSCINIFLAFNLSKKKNLGTCVLLTLTTALMEGLGVAYFISFTTSDEYAVTAAATQSFIILGVAMGFALVGLIFAYIFRDKFYKKDIF